MEIQIKLPMRTLQLASPFCEDPKGYFKGGDVL
jgi:hypothetical protein